MYFDHLPRVGGRVRAVRTISFIAVHVLSIALLSGGCSSGGTPRGESLGKDDADVGGSRDPALEVAPPGPPLLPGRRRPEEGVARQVPGRVKVRFRDEVVRRSFPFNPQSVGLARLELPEDERDGLVALGLALVRRAVPRLEQVESGNVEVITFAELRRRLGRPELSPAAAAAMAEVERDMVLVFPPTRDSKDLCSSLEALASVERCEPVTRGGVLAPVMPDDADFAANKQWGLHNVSLDFDIDAPEAWEQQKGKASIVVAVVDTGVDVTHRDIFEKIWINRNELPAAFLTQADAHSDADGEPSILTFVDLNSAGMASVNASFNLVDGNGNGYIDGQDLYETFADGIDGDPPATAGEIDDIVGWSFDPSDTGPLKLSENDHGTAVAGLVGAATDNSFGIAGVGWNTRIMPVGGDWSWPSIDYAIKNGADIITTSLAPNSDSAQLAAILSTLQAEGIPFTAALGNVDRYIPGTVYASYPYTIAVSNFGSNQTRSLGGSSVSVNVDLAAPGANMWSLDVPTGTRSFGGTSAANPIVAGVMSLLLAERANLTAEQYRQVLRMSAEDVPAVPGDRGENTPGFDYYSGWGLVNASNALTSVHADPILEAKLTNPFRGTYYGYKRGEVFHAAPATIPIWAFAGNPAGSPCDVRVEAAAGEPPNTGAWTTVYADASSPYRNDAELTTINRSALSQGVNTLRLTVTDGSSTRRDYQRVDVIHAYMNIADYALVTDDFNIEGIASHPQFARYKLQYAAGHNADETNPGLWTDVAGPVTTAAGLTLGSYYGWFDNTRHLFTAIPLDSLPAGDITLRLVVEDSTGGTLASHAVPVTTMEQVPAQGGFPLPLGGGGLGRGGPVTYDLDGDGNLELIFGGFSEVQVVHSDGTPVEGWPVSVGGLYVHNSPAVGDVDGDGLAEVVVRAIDLDTGADTLYVFSRSGESLSPWPLDLPTRTSFWGKPVDHAPVLADFDGDGDLEIAVSGTPDSVSDAAAVQIYQANGNLWASVGPSGAETLPLPPAVGDLNEDGVLEIAMVSTEGSNKYLSVWQANGAQVTSAPVLLPGTSSSVYFRGILVADIDDDEDLEIFVCFIHKVFGFHHDGTPIAGWNGADLPVSRLASIAAGDLTPDDGSSAPQIVASYFDYDSAQSVYRHGLYAFAQDGTILAGWDKLDVGLDQTFQQPSVFDLDNDGMMEVVIGPNEVTSTGTKALMRAVNHDGSSLSLPIAVEGNVVRAPAISDLDGDGDLELAVVGASFASQVEAYDLASLDDAGSVAWGMTGHDPQRTNNYHAGLRLLEPTTTRPTDVGSPSDPQQRSPLLVRVVKEVPTGAVNAGTLTVRIGDAPAQVSTVTMVGGEAWAVIMPPSQVGNGRYTLEVSWNDGGIRRVERQREAVQYSNILTPTDQVLVVDRSGSMQNDDKYLAARTAGRFYVSARGRLDTVGLVSFASTATTELDPPLVLGSDGSAERNQVEGAIDGVASPAGSTSIGGGLMRALDVLPSAAPGRRRAIVLVSDGLENTAPFWDAGTDPVRSRFESAANDDIAIHTIAIGSDADRELHGEISASTNGIARFVYVGNSLSIFSRLADAYKQVEERIGHFDRILTKGEDISAKQLVTYPVNIPRWVPRAQFAISARNLNASVGLRLLDPTGTDMTDSATRTSSASSTVLTLTDVSPGTYKLEVVARKGDTEVLATASVVASGVELAARLRFTHPVGDSGMRGTLLAALMTTGADGAGSFAQPVGMSARIITPDRQEVSVELYDDGNHGDGVASDGVYGCPVTFDLGGAYAMVVSSPVEGNGPTGTVEARVDYFQARAFDKDLDGLPDAWEKAHFGSEIAGRAGSDDDADGLSNYEEFRYRTDPVDHDSDADGRPDGAEVDDGTDPKVANPLEASPEDTDGDALPDDWERQNFPGSDPADVSPKDDPDGDGLSTFAEWRVGTDPDRADSDGDGVNDGLENSWRVPKPGTRGWKPQPYASAAQQGETNPAWRILIFLLLLLVAALVGTVVYQELRER